MNEGINICKNCGNRFQGSFCNRCGEKVYTDLDKSILHFFEDALHFVTHFEGTFFNTLKAIFSQPGKLSSDYCDGLRKNKAFRLLPGPLVVGRSKIFIAGNCTLFYRAGDL